MTGIFVRIERNSKWQNFEIEELTQEELTRFMLTRGETELRLWVNGLVKWIRENVRR